jgi:hypothetical protein
VDEKRGWGVYFLNYKRIFYICKLKMEQKKEIIYLDKNATTKIDKRVLEEMMP